MHFILIALVALLLFGPSKLPELGRGFGRMFREFKDATTGNGGSSDDRRDDSKKELTAGVNESHAAAEATQPTGQK
ncbi:twin-arginine translocase TatA/TatE family subunit [Paenibacillus sp. P26]|nr:twin-arginine translocase TatA/TatE family subunit [Paenibacillus sp. P26]UUZ97129.1 twin-arginine translocase TatA/TatE family subunit [Paenibacillus sp. P25]